MGRYNGSTAERGYGGKHPTIRKQRLAVYRPGHDQCAMGGEVLWQPPELLDVPHDHVNGGYLPGLACREHNRAEGASRGNRQRGFLPVSAGSNVVCVDCGKPYHYAAKACEMCSGHYHPTYSGQRTCGRACGIALRRAAGNLGAAGRARRQPRPICKTCGKPCLSLGSMYCSAACAGEASRNLNQTWPSSRLQHYTCRYCGKPGVTKATTQPREVCPARECQLARRAANNLRTRQGMTKDEADAHVRRVLRLAMQSHGPVGDGRWGW